MINIGKFIFIFTFISCFTLKSICLASLLGNFKFKVPRQATKVDQQRTVGSGSRSRCKSSIAAKSIELLVPTTKVAHQTVSTRPNLYLNSHVQRSQPIKVDFTLINPQSSKTLVKKTIPITSKGIKQISLPPSVKLLEKTIYLWKIGIPCQNNSNSYQTVLSAGVEKVSMSPSLITELTSQRSNIDKIQFFAQNGLWYETIDLAVKQLQEQDLLSFLLKI
jgi:hypothetical protein